MPRSGEIAGRVRRAYAWAEDRQIHYRRSGPIGGRSPLVLLQPHPVSIPALETFMSDLGGEHSIIAPDLPGMGMSDPPRDGEGPQAVAGVLLEVVAELGLGIVDLVGVKTAAAVATAMARLEPGVVRKLVLISPAPPQALADQPMLSLNLPEFPDAGREDAAKAIRDFLDR